MTQPGLPAIPWRDIETLAATWRAMAAAREEQARCLAPPSAASPDGDFWSARAADFRAAPHDGPADAFLSRLRALVDPAATVLDVGAGAGRYALRIAPDVREVVAVEPSPGMRDALQEDAAARGLRNVRVVAATWEDADVDRADVVICSHAVYFARDIVAFVRKLRQRAARSVLLAVRIDQVDAHARDLWLDLHGEPRAIEPTFVELHAILSALGVAPNVEVTRFAGSRTAFPSLDEAERRIAMLACAPPQRLDAVVRYARDRLRANADGVWEWTGPPIRSAIAWWREPPV